MDADQVAALRLLLGNSRWLEQTRSLARALRGRGARVPGELLLVGTPDEEPWHLAAHLDQESRLAGVPGLAPPLVRWSPPPDAPPHLRVGPPLLERVHDARQVGATILALDTGDPELDSMAHEYLAVAPGLAPFSFDAAQHLVSAAAGEPSGARTGLRGRLGRLLDAVSGTSAPCE